MIYKIKREAVALRSGYSLVGAIVGVVLAFITELSCGNFYVYRFLCLPRHAPPLLIFCLVFLAMMALIGYAVGTSFALSYAKCRGGKGGMVFESLAGLFALLWYIAFFATFSFLFGLFLLLCSIAMSALAFKEWWGKFCIPALFAAGQMAICIFFLWIDFSVILLN